MGPCAAHGGSCPPDTVDFRRFLPNAVRQRIFAFEKRSKTKGKKGNHRGAVLVVVLIAHGSRMPGNAETYMDERF
jgi:hypothetical protein